MLAHPLFAQPLSAQQGQPGDQQPEARVPVDVDAEQHMRPVQELSLEQALRLGRRQNVGLRAAELLPEQARMDVIFAEAGFEPELYGSAGYAESVSPQRFLQTTGVTLPSFKSTTMDAQVGWRQRVATGGLFDLAYQPTRFVSGQFGTKQFTSIWSASFRQPLLRAGWTDYNLAPIDSARFRLNQTSQQFERVVQDTLLQIVQAYWELAFARENWRVVSSALAVAQEQLRITDQRIRVEALAPRDRIADEAEVARRREEQIVAQNTIRDREDDLRRQLFDGGDPMAWRVNLRPVSEIEITPPDIDRSFEELVEVAVKFRPDVKSQESLLSEAEVALLQAERDSLPKLDLIGAYSSDGVRNNFTSSFTDAWQQQFPDWSVRLEFAVPIGNHAARSREQRAKLEVERQNRVLHGLILDVTKQVREAVRSLDTLTQSIRASRESVRLAESNLETEQVKLRVGASTAFEVQRRNQELREARSRLLRNQIDYRVAESRLLYAQGLLRADG
ncbi:MAG: TolC family protein [Planctomycetes bacterium]|nr:TolC family protein [Planctomycetota bacterium]